MSGKQIIVIGGGVIGASIAWHLAKAGARVTVFCGERGGVATPNSFAWINANWGNPSPISGCAWRPWPAGAGLPPECPASILSGAARSAMTCRRRARKIRGRTFSLGL